VCPDLHVACCAAVALCAGSNALRVPLPYQPQVRVCKEQVEWARTEKRAFLRQRVELRLAGLYLDSKLFQDALVLISS
jgi:26S proteasome regulatory subunit N6